MPFAFCSTESRILSRIEPLRIFLRYFVTKTKWTTNLEELCLHFPRRNCIPETRVL